MSLLRVTGREMTIVHAALDSDRRACVRRAINELIEWLEMPNSGVLQNAHDALSTALEYERVQSQLVANKVGEEG